MKMNFGNTPERSEKVKRKFNEQIIFYKTVINNPHAFRPAQEPLRENVYLLSVLTALVTSGRLGSSALESAGFLSDQFREFVSSKRACNKKPLGPSRPVID